MNKYRGYYRYNSQPIATGTIVPFLQKIRQCSHTRLDIERREEQSQQDQRKGSWGVANLVAGLVTLA